MNIAIITGASSGLGREYVAQLAKLPSPPEEVWLIARREERLQAIADAFPSLKCRCLALDLQQDDALTAYAQRLKEENPCITLLINNAGYGKLGNFADGNTAEQVGMVDLNCRALTAITSLSLPYMKKGSGILNVCSIAAFAPTPRMTVYCSTKAYVYSFSKALRRELKPLGIAVSAVCPGPMATEFLEVADIVGRSKTFQTLPYCSPRTVAEKSLRALRKGKGVYTNLLFFKFYRVLAKILPHNLVMYMSKT